MKIKITLMALLLIVLFFGCLREEYSWKENVLSSSDMLKISLEDPKCLSFVKQLNLGQRSNGDTVSASRPTFTAEVMEQLPGYSASFRDDGVTYRFYGNGCVQACKDDDGVIRWKICRYAERTCLDMMRLHLIVLFLLSALVMIGFVYDFYVYKNRKFKLLWTLFLAFFTGAILFWEVPLCREELRLVLQSVDQPLAEIKAIPWVELLKNDPAGIAEYDGRPLLIGKKDVFGIDFSQCKLAPYRFVCYIPGDDTGKLRALTDAATVQRLAEPDLFLVTHDDLLRAAGSLLFFRLIVCGMWLFMTAALLVSQRKVFFPKKVLERPQENIEKASREIM